MELASRRQAADGYTPLAEQPISQPTQPFTEPAAAAAAASGHLPPKDAADEGNRQFWTSLVIENLNVDAKSSCVMI